MYTLSFRAMGSPCRIVVNHAASDLADAGQQMIQAMEQNWSRFLLASEICQLNRQAGHMMVLSPLTYTLVDHAATACWATDGVFNPLMLDQLEDLGYSRPWAERISDPQTNRPESLGSLGWPASGDRIELFPEISAVRLPPGTRFDPGGIGKGLAADLVTDFLVAHGATTISVEMGGDIRVSGEPWYGPSWRVGIVHPFDHDAEVAAFTPEFGAVATSSRLGRRWVVGEQDRHHLLDPNTGRSAVTDLVASTASGATAWWAEVVAKVVLIGGAEFAQQHWGRFALTGVAVTETGVVLQSGAPRPADEVTVESLFETPSSQLKKEAVV